MEEIRAMAASFIGRVARVWLSVTSRVRYGRAGAGDDHQGGQGLAEYALILAGIAVVAITSLVFLGGTITELFWDPIDEQFGQVLCDVIGLC